jgi:hypothetical protein
MGKTWKDKQFEITAKKFKGTALNGSIKLPEEIKKEVGKSHLSWKDKPIIINEGLSNLLDADYFDKKEVTE